MSNNPIIGLVETAVTRVGGLYYSSVSPCRSDRSAGADIIAIDATLRQRPGGETLETLIARIHDELGKRVMADVDTIESAIASRKAGADMVGYHSLRLHGSNSTPLSPWL
jgi:N-acylglucosamine-6-phosphate 2-epimerase